MAKLADQRVTIAGLGLMGGSLAWALRGQVAALHAVDPNPDTRSAALAAGLVAAAWPDLAPALPHTDLLILAAPVGGILALLADLHSYAGPPLQVLDLGSTKQQIVAAMNPLPPQIDGLGGHPMCGKETAGFEHATADLYHSKTFVLTPLSRTTPELLALAQALVAAIGAHPVILAADRHDALVAITSHLPYLLAASLMQTAQAAAEQDAALWTVAASGFRDMTRLAASSPQVMTDILTTNAPTVRAAIAQQQRALTAFEALLDQPAVLQAALSNLQANLPNRLPIGVNHETGH